MSQNSNIATCDKSIENICIIVITCENQFYSVFIYALYLSELYKMHKKHFKVEFFDEDQFIKIAIDCSLFWHIDNNGIRTAAEAFFFKH